MHYAMETVGLKGRRIGGTASTVNNIGTESHHHGNIEDPSELERSGY